MEKKSIYINKLENANHTANKNKTSRKYLKGIIFARAICCIGIIFYHYFGKSNGEFKLLFKTANSTFGFIFVTSFFCISGTVLYYNYPKITSLRTFYFKRWKSIFPPYYICYLFKLKNILPIHKLDFKYNWPRFFFTLIGMDTYLHYKYKTFALIGEWFLGPIIIIYILYPLLSWMMNINILIINFITSVGYILMYRTNYFIIMKDVNIITCVTSFYFGMLAIKFENIFFKNKITFIVSFIIYTYLYLYKLRELILIRQIQGFTLFILLVQIGEYIMASRIKGIFIIISTLSYNIFLIHHGMIHYILGIYNPMKWYWHIFLFGITLILTMFYSKILLIIVNAMIQSHMFKKIEGLFIKT